MANIQSTTAPIESGLSAPPARAPRPEPWPEAGQRFIIPALNWDSYRKIADALQGRHFRLAFDGENLELMTISSAHGNCGRLIGRLVAVLTEEMNLPLKACGDMSCDRKAMEKGIEPDETFYIANEPRIRERAKIDLEVDPPPDLAVEVDITRSSLDRFAIYAALRVPEVWRFDGETLHIHQLSNDARYLAVERSKCFPFLSGADLAQFLNRRTEADDNTLVRSFRQWVRERLGKKE